MNVKLWTLAGLSATILGGCQDPMSRDVTAELQRQIVEANRRQISAAQPPAPITVAPPDVTLYAAQNPGRLDEISGPGVFANIPLQMGVGLNNAPSPVAALTLEQATRVAAAGNLDIAIAQIQPAISEAAVVQAEAAFDAVFFTDVQAAKIDRPQAAAVLAGGLIGTNTQVADTANLTTGIRKPLFSGGELTVATGFDYSDNETPGLTTRPDPAWTSDILVGITQPLLRNFGEDVNRAQIFLTRNAFLSDALDLHRQLVTTIGDVEATYWNLVAARHTLAIQQRLLGMTEDTQQTLIRRAQFDVNPVQVAQAAAFVELRREEVIRARNNVRLFSDRLKRLLHDPRLPMADETLIVPLDNPMEQPLTFSLLDSITTALRHRSELRQALLSIDDASIRQRVADNQLLPLLTLNAQIQYRGLEDDLPDSYGELFDGDFIEYLVGAQFEQPIGNRAAEAQARQASLARQQSVLAYKRAVQDVVLEVKDALRTVQTAYELIAVTRAGRRAAAENLRALLEREEKGEALTPEFLLDLKLNTQQRLADAEIRELQATVDYNIAIARLYQATGTLLERNQINFDWPKEMFDDASAGNGQQPGNQQGDNNAADRAADQQRMLTAP
jgi:outer membrane protein TolC